MTAATKKSWRDVIEIHPIADVFPQLEGQELADLSDDIKANGLQTPVLLWEQLLPDFPEAEPKVYLLDGRNRLDAMERADIDFFNTDGTALDPGLVEQFSSDSPVSAGSLVISRNIHRRHLTPSQRAKLTAKALLADREFQASLTAQDANGQVSPGGNELPSGSVGVKGEPNVNKSEVAQVAEAAGVSRPTARKAVEEAKAEAAGEPPKPKAKPGPKPKAKRESANTSKQTAVNSISVLVSDLQRDVKALQRRKQFSDAELTAIGHRIEDLRGIALSLQAIIKEHAKPAAA